METTPIRAFNGHTPELGQATYIDSAATVIGEVPSVPMFPCGPAR